MFLFFLRVFITLIVVLLIAHIIPGLEIKDFLDACLFGLILGVVNSTVRPLLVLLTLPITLLTLGLFTLFINIFTFWLASEISYGVAVHTFWAAFWGGFSIWMTGLFTNRFLWNRN